MAAEANLWQSLKTRFERAGFFYQRIENTTVEGVPDVWVGKDTVAAWLELKAVDGFPVRGSTRVFGVKGLRKEQVNWHLQAAAKGVQTYIFAGVGVGVRRQTFLVPGVLAAEFNDMHRARLEDFICPLDQVCQQLKDLVI